MQRDIKEVIGVLMRVIGGGEATREEVEELTFDADGDLRTATNEAFLKLMEFAYDRDERSKDAARDTAMRRELQAVLDELVRTADRQPPRP